MVQNSLLRLYEREQGLSNERIYDTVLSRLRVAKEDSWRGILPSEYSTDFNPQPPIFAAKFSKCEPYKHILALASEDGKIALQNINVRNEGYYERPIDGYNCHFNAIFDIDWAPYQLKLVSASGDHTAKLWALCASGLRYVRAFKGHCRSVKSIAFKKNDPTVFATGSRDGGILIWDTRIAFRTFVTARADSSIFVAGNLNSLAVYRKERKEKLRPKKNIAASSITGLVFQNDHTLISCGAGDGVIKIWDMRRNYIFKGEPTPKYCIPYTGTSTFKNFTNVIVDEAGTKLYANCMDNSIYCYNLTSATPKIIRQFVGLRNSTFYIKSCLSPDDNYLLSGSSDEKAYLWNVNNPLPLLTLNGHSIEVTCVAWDGVENMNIVTCSDDARHKIWRVGQKSLDEDENSNAGKAEPFKPTEELLSRCNRSASLNKFLTQEKASTSKRTYLQMNLSIDVSVKKNSSDVGWLLVLPENKNPLHTSSTQKDTVNTTTHKDKIKDKIDEVNSPKNTNESNLNSSETTSSTVSAVLSEQSQQQQQQQPSTSAAMKFPSTDKFCPTLNLPNYVIDGEAPHLSIMSPKRNKTTTDNVDWLTTLRKRKINAKSNLQHKFNSRYVDKIQPKPSTSTPKPSTSGCNNHFRNNVRSHSNETSILRFFSPQQPPEKRFKKIPETDIE